MTRDTPTVYAFMCGTTTIPAKNIIDGAEGTMTLPVPAFLITHPQGNLVFDTGFNRMIYADREHYGPEGFFDTRAFGFSFEEELPSRMRAAGFDPMSVKYVVNSHLHYDHCGGNALFPDATVIMQEREWMAATLAPDEAPAYRKVDFQTQQKKLLLNGDHDVFGDGSVVLTTTFGHTPGHQSLVVRTGEGTVVLTADACYLRETFEGGPLPGLRTDAEEFAASLEKLRGLGADGALVAFGHDPEFWASMPLGPEPLSAGALASRSRPDYP